MKTETRAVLAGAYKKLDSKSLLTHTVELDETGMEIRVVCGRVKLESICDTYGQDTSLPPTCPRCLAKAGR